MSVSVISMTGRPVWKMLGSGPASVAIAERDALGTTARVVAWPSFALRRALGAVDRELERLDLAASRFRPDSELSRIHQRDGGLVRGQRGPR